MGVLSCMFTNNISYVNGPNLWTCYNDCAVIFQKFAFNLSIFQQLHDANTFIDFKAYNMHNGHSIIDLNKQSRQQLYPKERRTRLIIFFHLKIHKNINKNLLFFLQKKQHEIGMLWGTTTHSMRIKVSILHTVQLFSNQTCI